MTTLHTILTQHTGVVGKTGSGKTSTLKLIIESVARRGDRVCILDPIKSDHWGLTSSADGTKPGLPFHILGGPRGHVPLHEGAGKAIGDLVASGALPLSIIDMADFKPGGLQRFFVDFAEALFRRMRGILYLVIEEAHEFAPKERAGIGDENYAIHWAKKLATASRAKGIRLIVATQRTQSLHNAVLGSCETLITHRLTLPADQKPIIDWLKTNLDKPTMEKVAGSLSSLKTGHGWVCSGEAKVTELVHFPRITTFDNSATPTSDAAALEVTTAAVDQDKLRAIIGDAVKEAEANDPKTLQARIRELEGAIAAGVDAAGVDEVVADPQAEERAFNFGRKEGFENGYIQGYGVGWRDCRALFAEVIPPLNGAYRKAEMEPFVGNVQVPEDRHRYRPETAVPLQSGNASDFRKVPTQVKQIPDLPVRSSPRAAEVAKQYTANDPPQGAAEVLLRALAKVCPAKLTWSQAAAIAGKKAHGGWFNKGRKWMVDTGAIEESGEMLAITDCGLSAIGAERRHAITPADHRRIWLEALPEPAKGMLAHLIDAHAYQSSWDKIAKDLGKQPTGGYWNSGRAILRQNGLVSEIAGGAVGLANHLRD
jgi:Helicase HerA, central domain